MKMFRRERLLNALALKIGSSFVNSYIMVIYCILNQETSVSQLEIAYELIFLSLSPGSFLFLGQLSTNMRTYVREGLISTIFHRHRVQKLLNLES